MKLAFSEPFREIATDSKRTELLCIRKKAYPISSFCWNKKEESIANKGGRNNRRRFTARKEIKFFFCKIKFLRQCCIFESEEKFLAKNNLGGVLTLFWRFSWPFKLTFNVGPGFRWNDVVGQKHFKWKKLTNADSVTEKNLKRFGNKKVRWRTGKCPSFLELEWVPKLGPKAQAWWKSHHKEARYLIQPGLLAKPRKFLAGSTELSDIQGSIKNKLISRAQ